MKRKQITPEIPSPQPETKTSYTRLKNKLTRIIPMDGMEIIVTLTHQGITFRRLKRKTSIMIRWDKILKLTGESTGWCRDAHRTAQMVLHNDS